MSQVPGQRQVLDLGLETWDLGLESYLRIIVASIVATSFASRPVRA